MIAEHLYPPAHKAIHRLVINARFWAYSEEPQARIAKLLDETEYLIGMLYEPPDRTEDFFRYLQSVCKDFGWRGIFDEFAAHDRQSVVSDTHSD